MSKAENKAPVAEAKEPTVAELMAELAALRKQVEAKEAKPEADFSELQAEAAKAGFKHQVVPSLQKGASPALRVDY